MKNRSHRYDINRPRARLGHNYTKYVLSDTKQHLKLNSWKN